MARIAEIIKYEGDNSTFIWKHPSEDFNSLTQLIVHENQEAIFFMNGQALDLFGPGRHTLETQNIPIIGKLLNRATGGQTPFHCEVYFINKSVQMALKWGTNTRVRFLEPTYGVPLEIGAHGEMNLMVSDSRKLLIKLVGTTAGIAWEDHPGSNGFTTSLKSAFRPLISTVVKSNLATCIKSQNINILEVDEHLGILSDTLKQSIVPGFEEYGLTIPEFYVTGVDLPDPKQDENFRRICELHSVTLQKRMIEADTEVSKKRIEAKTEVKVSIADAAATVTAAKRKAILEQETTATEQARRAAERELIDAQVKAQAAKMAGFAEAEIMHAKGYDQRDVIQSEVQKAYAAGIGNMHINGGAAGDMIGLGVGMAAAGAVVPQLSDMFKVFSTGNTPHVPDEQCTKCGAVLPANAKFCLQCGEKVVPPVPDHMVICPSCGKTVAKGKFCLECGHPFQTSCPNCGKEIVAGAKFCLECGQKL